MKALNILKDVIQYIMLPLIYFGYTSLASDIEKNSEMLQQMRSSQVQIISSINNHIAFTGRDIEQRARFHHTTNRNCLLCKDPSGENYPTPNLLPKGDIMK